MDIKIPIIIIAFIVLLKELLFWLWLWQLKEYHCGRIMAHFERQKTRKFITSFTWLKYPKFTTKALIILLAGILIEGFALWWIYFLAANFFYLAVIVFVIAAPLFFSLLILAFQIPTIILINQTLKKAKQKREKFKNLLVIGITGSYGKTSAKEFLAEILSKKYNVLKTKKHINAEIGIAKTILNNLKPEHQIFIAEIGAYNTGKIKQVCQALQPKIGILTGINEQHMSMFGSQENIIKAKYELIEALPEDGLAIFNGNNKHCKKLYEQTNITKRLISAKSQNNIFQPLAENIELAKAAAKELAMDAGEINQAADKISQELGSRRIKKGINGLNIIDAAYSANPDGVLADLDYLQAQPGKKILVMPCLIELGSSAKKVHKKIAEKIAKTCDLAIICTRDYFREIKKHATLSGMPLENIVLIEKPDKILEKIKSFAQAEDIILLESRVPKALLWKLKK